MARPIFREFRSEDYPALADLWRTVHPDTPYTAEEIEREDRSLPPKYRWARIVADVDGAIAGSAIFDQNPGMYHPQVFQVDVMVAPEFRGRRIGALLHERIERLLEPHRPTKRLGRIEANDAAALAFVTGLGYRETKRDVNSVLDLDRFDPDPWRDLMRDVDAQDLEFVSLIDVRSDATRVRSYYDLFSRVRADAPRSLPATPIDFDFFVSEVVELPEAVPEATTFAFDGSRCVGFTQVYKSDATPELQTGLTGVDGAYRRRGIATALKIRALTSAKAAGAPRIRTDNDARNTGMLAVNATLGFVERPAQITVAWNAEAGAGDSAGDSGRDRAHV